MNLDELGDHDPDMYEAVHTRICQTAERWCKEYFRQSWAQVWELGHVPVVYPEMLFGYRVVVEMPDYPQRELVDVLLTSDWSIVEVKWPSCV
jgi:hypothetical protein